MYTAKNNNLLFFEVGNKKNYDRGCELRPL